MTMVIKVTPPEQVKAAWRAHDAQAVRTRLDSTRPSIVMADEAAALLDHRERVFRGRSYRVPPIPWPLAVKLLACQEQFRTTAARVDATPDETAALFARAVDLIKRTMQPKGPLRRLLWRIAPNPFWKATPAEVGALMGFFFACLMRDGSGPMQAPTAPPGTSPTRSRPSPSGAPVGPGATGSRSRGATS